MTNVHDIAKRMIDQMDRRIAELRERLDKEELYSDRSTEIVDEISHWRYHILLINRFLKSHTVEEKKI